MRCGDEEVPPEQLDDVWTLTCDTFDKVEAVTGNAGEVVADALQVTRRALATTYALTREASEKLAEGAIQTAMQSLIECSSTWSRVHHAVVQSCSLLAIDPAITQVAGRLLADWLREVAKMLISIRNAMQSRDYVNLGDILRYEMDDMLGGWEQMLDGLAEYALKTTCAAA